MTHKTKLIGLVFLAGALISLILLAASLSTLQLLPGIPFPPGDNSDSEIQPVPTQKLVQSYSIPLTRGLFAFVFLILLVYVPVRLMTLINFQKILRLVPALILLIIIGYLLPKIKPDQPPYFPNEPPELKTPPPINYPSNPLGEPPQVLIWFVIIIIVIGMSLFIIKTLRTWMVSNKAEDQLLQEAENAINALKAGVGLRNVIICCYIQMTRSLQEKQGIDRHATMTVREFELCLESLGYPVTPVHQLTSLFEKVRYSKQQVGPEDEKKALESLSEIIQHSRSGVD